MEKIVLTCADTSAQFLAAELEPDFPRLPPLEWVEPGIAIAQVDYGFNAFASECRHHQPIFLRHIAPAQCEVPLEGTEQDLERLAEAALALTSRLKSGQTFAVQSRLFSAETSAYKTFTINQTISERIAAQTGLTVDVRSPEQVVSILVSGGRGYTGISRTDQNRSAWVGGEQKFKREEAQVSRSEFKLLEAFSVFNLKPPGKGWALDLGAAPGGWTRILRLQGMRVVALDPGELDKRLHADRGITRVRKRIQDYLPAPQPFDVLVNDMRMEATDSAELMVAASASLRPGGLAVMTIKLPESEHRPEAILNTTRIAKAILSESFSVRDIRQLYHNRSEVTAILHKIV